MGQRTLSITLQSDWKSSLKQAGKAAQQGNSYQGEQLNFQSPGIFFSRLTERRWQLINLLQDQDEAIGVRALAREAGRDVKRVHEDVRILLELGLVEQDEKGKYLCPYADIHVDMHIKPKAA